MAKYKTEDTDSNVVQPEDEAGTPEQNFQLVKQKPEFQSAYADYQARMSQQKGAAIANPEEYYKYLSVAAHARWQAQQNAKGKSSGQSPQGQPQPAQQSLGSGLSADADQVYRDVKAGRYQ